MLKEQDDEFLQHLIMNKNEYEILERKMIIYHACSATLQSVCFPGNPGPLALLLHLLLDFLLRWTIHIFPQIFQQFCVSKSKLEPGRRVKG